MKQSSPKRDIKILTVALAFLWIGGAGTSYAVDDIAALDGPSQDAIPSGGALSSDTVLEQGKELYNKGQYVPALDKFMKVLRRDPQHPEARQYLRLVVDQLRSKRRVSRRGAESTPAPSPAQSLPARTVTGERPIQTPVAKANVPVPFIDEEVRQRVRQRQLLTLDLGAIPGVKINVGQKQSQVEIKTPLLFGDKTGGLREEGIPLLDRVAAWLKTFGQQPIAIHCYPEELDNSNLNGSLFLHRYAQLYGFFVEERKLPATRFIESELPKTGKESGKDKESAEDVPAESAAISTETARIVIVSIGGGSAEEQEAPLPKQSRWLEFSMLASRISFNPQEGESATLDLSVLTRNGVKDWSFKISPTAGNSTSPVLSMEGKGNLLKRVSWDGREQKSGNFVPPGSYLCKLSATNSEGLVTTKEVTLKIQNIIEQAQVLAAAPQRSAAPLLKQKTKPKAKPKPAAKVKASVKTVAPVVSSLPEATAPAILKKNETLSEPAAAAETEKELNEDSEEPSASTEPADDSSHAIWKQVIQFDTNESDLKPTLKASLERISKTLEVYPLQKVRIMGFAEASETNAAVLAKQRAERVRQTLINEYQVDASRVIVAGGRIGSAGKVEISITN